MRIIKTTYDDTRDLAIKIIDQLSDNELIIINDENYFDFQDIIQENINRLLTLDIDNNFEIEITTKKIVL